MISSICAQLSSKGEWRRTVRDESVLFSQFATFVVIYDDQICGHINNGNFIAVNRKYCVARSLISRFSTASLFWQRITLVQMLINVSKNDDAFFGYVIVQRTASVRCIWCEIDAKFAVNWVL